MRYAVVGANGQLGREIMQRLGSAALPVTRAQADLTHGDALKAALDAIAPDVVINCAAYNYVDRAETEPPAALAVNAWAARDLAIYCRDRGCTLAHFSTDYVFGLDENRATPWLESDGPGPVSVYGLSKLAGEYVVRAYCPRHLVIRTCGIYGLWGSGGKGGNFVETMLRVASQGKPLRVVNDQRCTPTAAADLADAALALIATGQYGLFHLTNGGSCTWYELAAAIFEHEGTQADLAPITSREFGAPARRPAYSVLANTTAVAAGVPALRPWRDALAAYLAARRVFRAGGL